MSSESSSYPIDWQPSRLLGLALLALGALAAVSVLLSAMPWALRLPLMAVAAGQGLRLARRETARMPCQVQLDAEGSGLALVYADHVQRLTGRQLHFRGPLARLSGSAADGRCQHLLWWPDTLPPAARRALHLAADKSIGETRPALATIPA